MLRRGADLPDEFNASPLAPLEDHRRLRRRCTRNAVLARLAANPAVRITSIVPRRSSTTARRSPSALAVVDPLASPAPASASRSSTRASPLARRPVERLERVVSVRQPARRRVRRLRQRRPTPYDDNGHGTHVAGIIAGNGYDSDGQKAGVAPDAQLVSLKVLDANGNGTISNVIAALDWVLANRTTYNIRVVNLSVGAAVTIVLDRPADARGETRRRCRHRRRRRPPATSATTRPGRRSTAASSRPATRRG